jgi:hypothetical protein
MTDELTAAYQRHKKSEVRDTLPSTAEEAQEILTLAYDKYCFGHQFSRDIPPVEWPEFPEPASEAERVVKGALDDIRSGNLGDITRAIVILAEVEEDGSVGTHLRTATKNQLETLGLIAAALDDAQLNQG